MAALTRNSISAIVKQSLLTVAALPEANFESASFAGLTKTQERTFLAALKANLNKAPYIMNDGTSSTAAYYDVALKADIVKDWPTIGDCIDWVYDNQIIVTNN